MYFANVALGSGVALRLFSTGSFRWIHHAVYIGTCLLGAAAVSTLLWTDSDAGWILLPAVLPLAALPFAGSGSSAALGFASRRHVVVALLAAPFFVASMIVSWR